MNCDRAGEIVSYLKSETAEPEREEFRRHLDGCTSCARGLARVDRLLAALGKLERVEPDPGFTGRVRRAFAAAHPEFLERTAGLRRAPPWWESLRSQFDYVPAWAISVAVHVLLLAVAAVVFLSPTKEKEPPQGTAIYAQPREPEGDPKWEPRRRWGAADFGPERERTWTPDHSGGRVSPRLRSGSFEGRFDSRRWGERLKRRDRTLAYFEPRLRDDGKGRRVREAARRALAWLARNQESDGRWSGARFGGKADYDVALTGLALLAFLGDGHTTRTGGFAATVEKGVRYLLSQQKPNGLIGANEGRSLYNHGVAGLAILEAYLLTQEEGLAAPASSAVAFSVAAQNRTGGWGYRYREAVNDTSVGGWQIFLLRLSFASGNRSVIPALTQAAERLARVTDPQGRVGYRERSQFPHGYAALTAVGMTSYLLATPNPDPETLRLQARLLIEKKAVVDSDGAANDLYLGYFGSLALFQVGGEEARSWIDDLHQSLLRRQGPEGAWPRAFDKWSSYGGQVYTTAMSALILEVRRRYPRLLP